MEEKRKDHEKVREYLADIDSEVLLADGFDEAIIGTVERFSSGPLVLYDREKCIQILMGQEMTRSEAEEFFDYNVTGAWMGDGTPCFATLAKDLPI